MKFNFEKKNLKITDKKLKVDWSFENYQDLSEHFAVDMVNIMSNQIKDEIDRQLRYYMMTLNEIKKLPYEELKKLFNNIDGFFIDDVKNYLRSEKLQYDRVESLKYL
jgi:RNA processing factor Prp31